jgi:serine/threonine-protein kinase
LGVVLFEMLTGQLPFTASSADELARMHREALPPSPRQYNPAIPVPLEQIVLKVLSKEPSTRYRTADQLGSVLASFNPQAPLYPSVVLPAAVEGPRRTPAAAPSTPASSASRPLQPPRQPKPQPIIVRPAPTPANFDWLTWLLALLALIALGGLLPYWLWVFYSLNPPV